MEGEIIKIRQQIENSGPTVKFVDLFMKKQNFRPLLISLMLMIGQQFSGVNAVLFFSVDIFHASGTDMNSFVENIILALVQVFATLFAASIVDKAGRKCLLLVSAMAMAISEIALGEKNETKRMKLKLISKFQDSTSG